jgi:5'-nucleotidase (lipoprotein e(P4) family)
MNRPCRDWVVLGLLGPVCTISLAVPPQDQVNAVLWQQRSVEYEAAAKQTYRQAALALAQALRSCTPTACTPVAMEQLKIAQSDLAGMRAAVILDIDETALDNSPYQGELQRTGDDYNAAKWSQWVDLSSADGAKARFRRLSVPGAAEFTRKAESLGADVFYISNRECKGEATRAKCAALDQTMRVMEREGFARATDESAFLFKVGDSNKTTRRMKVASLPRRIAMMVGDDLGDFVDAKVRDNLRAGRKSEFQSGDLDHIDAQWGITWFVLPNPAYGSWERFAASGAQALCPKLKDGASPDAQFAAAQACRLMKANAKDGMVLSMAPLNLRVATWNLGWHVSKAELGPWVAACSKMYLRNATTKSWEPVADGTAGATQGWMVKESRATIVGNDLSIMPPCNTYQNAAFQGIAVTAAAYDKRDRQLSQVLARDVNADVIAFQEVSGVAAVRDALGASADDYYVCSFEPKYKVQRLAFAWRRTLGPAVEGCADVAAMSLPSLDPVDQVRPGFTVTLNVGGQSIRFLTVHLKSGCVSPLDKTPRILDGNSGPTDPCPILQQQVQPLEDVFEMLSEGVDHFVVMGDFNRNLWHEANVVKGAEARRSDNSTDLQAPRPSGVLVHNLLLEVDDGKPTESKAVLLAAHCQGDVAVQAACDKSKVDVLTAAESTVLTKATGLGCRNPVGLDHVLVSESLKNAVTSVAKVSIGASGGSRSPSLPNFPEALLAVSDHCPTVVDLAW